jgi:Type I phosphodiesterase / nucleotide pyrophosphatase
MTWRSSLGGALLAGLLATGIFGCEQPAPRAARPEAAPLQSAGHRPARGGARLVVLLVFDQLPSWALDRYGAALHAEGLLRQGARRGVWIERVSFPYAGTSTAPGHAAIVSGKPPRESGVVGNEVWDRQRGAVVAAVDDGRHAVFGNPAAFAAPSVLRAETVADRLRRQRPGARVVSLSHKDRAAVLMGGKRPDAAVWYDAKLPGFTTSSYYAARVPAWLAAWRHRHPVERLLVPWTPALPAALLERMVGPDQAPGEGGWLQLGAVFPYDARRSDRPYRALRAWPTLADELLALADAAIAEYGLGADDVPDLLAISIGTLDYVGHAFGGDSWEYVDALARVDRAVGAWLARLEKRTSIAVVASSDHGAAPMPERAAAAGQRGGRIDAIVLEAELEAALRARLGAGEWIDAYEPPFIYLSAAAEASAEVRGRALAAVSADLSRRPSIAWAGPVDGPALQAGAPLVPPMTEALRRAIALSIAPGGDGDVFVVPARLYSVVEDEPRDSGVNHGSPWPYDREVPLVFYGPGAAARRVRGPLPQDRVAAALAGLLGLDWPGADAALRGE